jgi:hypothetical protein
MGLSHLKSQHVKAKNKNRKKVTTTTTTTKPTQIESSKKYLEEATTLQ